MIAALAGCEQSEEPVVEVLEPEVEINIHEMTIAEIVENMTIQEKAGQMIQAERGSIQPHEVKFYNIGSILSGGGSHPTNNSEEGWQSLVKKYQDAALNSSAGIPLLYGIDAVHGHNNLKGAVLFPHNIGLGAANDAELMYKIGVATTEQMVSTGIHWNFTPSIAVAQDARWGRFYESFSQSNEVHNNIVSSYINGLQSNGVIATAKHYIGDGATSWNEASGWYKIDRGNAVMTEEELREIYLPPYEVAIAAGVQTIMTSYNSYNGEKMHGHEYLITDVLKGELGFEGFIITDWEGIHELPGDLYQQVVSAINAGNDMLMEPYVWKDAFRHIVTAAENGDIPMERIDDAVTRILTVKKEMGLFDTPHYEAVESSNHYEIAVEAVQKSSVLLKNESILPLEESMKVLLLGPARDSVGFQSGGWSYSWQGGEHSEIFGTTILDGFNNHNIEVYTSIEDADKCDVVVLALGEKPYAEGVGDNGLLTLDSHTALNNVEAHNEAIETGLPIVTILIAGRPMIVTEEINEWDAFIMSHLPGSAGEAIIDLLYGEVNFTGMLPYAWPRDIGQVGKIEDVNYLFDLGFGLTYNEE